MGDEMNNNGSIVESWLESRFQERALKLFLSRNELDDVHSLKMKERVVLKENSELR